LKPKGNEVVFVRDVERLIALQPSPDKLSGRGAASFGLWNLSSIPQILNFKRAVVTLSCRSWDLTL
jgi:hypothetical protein